MTRARHSDSTAARPYLRRATPAPAHSLALAAAPLALAAVASHPELTAAATAAFVALAAVRGRPTR